MFTTYNTKECISPKSCHTDLTHFTKYIVCSCWSPGPMLIRAHASNGAAQAKISIMMKA